jgi:hypothetical protein
MQLGPTMRRPYPLRAVQHVGFAGFAFPPDLGEAGRHDAHRHDPELAGFVDHVVHQRAGDAHDHEVGRLGQSRSDG